MRKILTHPLIKRLKVLNMTKKGQIRDKVSQTKVLSSPNCKQIASTGDKFKTNKTRSCTCLFPNSYSVGKTLRPRKLLDLGWMELTFGGLHRIFPSESLERLCSLLAAFKSDCGCNSMWSPSESPFQKRVRSTCCARSSMVSLGGVGI
jgi:hypothetical protein